MPPRKKKTTEAGGKGIIEGVKNLIYGRKDFPPSSKKVIEANASAKITGITLHRKVLNKIYHAVINIATKGMLENLIKETDKDKLFHTSMWIKLDNGHTILLEKNEVLNAKLNPKEAKEEETMDVNVTHSLTLRELVENTKKEMGDQFASYSAKTNNCTDFIIAVLKANNLITKQSHDWLFQNSIKILESVPRLNKVIQAITDIAGRANVLLEGGRIEHHDNNTGRGHKKTPKNKQEKKMEKYKAEHRSLYESPEVKKRNDAKEEKARKKKEKEEKEKGAYERRLDAWEKITGKRKIGFDDDDYDKEEIMKKIKEEEEKMKNLQKNPYLTDDELKEIREKVEKRTKIHDAIMRGKRKSRREKLPQKAEENRKKAEEEALNQSKIEHNERLGIYLPHTAAKGLKRKAEKKKNISPSIKMTRKHLVKGSPEAKEWAAKMKAARHAKKAGHMKGKGWLDDVVSNVKSTMETAAKSVTGKGTGSMDAAAGGRGVNPIAQSLIETKAASTSNNGKGMRHKKGSAEAKAWGAKMKAARQAKMKGKGVKQPSKSESESESDEESDGESSSDEDEEYEDELIKKSLKKEFPSNKGKGLFESMFTPPFYMLHPALQSQVTTNPNLGQGLKTHAPSHHLAHITHEMHHIPEPPSRLPVSRIRARGVGPRSRNYVTDETLI